MEKTHICKANLCIENLNLVMKNKLARLHKKIEVLERHSDAFVYIISGSCKYTFDSGLSFTSHPGDVFYLPYKSVYTMQIGEDDYRFIYCDFEFHSSGGVPAIFPSESFGNADTLFTRLLNLYRENPIVNYTECMSVLYGIYSSIKHSEVHSSHGRDNVIESARAMMGERFSDPDLCITSLYDRNMISDVYFRKLFKEKYGLSPIKYLNSLRLDNAKKLMKYPFISLEECAVQSGFSTVQYFARTFKSNLGVSPGKYRKNQ